MLPLGVKQLHAAGLRPPYKGRVFRHAVPTSKLPDQHAGLVLLQDRNDLLLRIALPILQGTSFRSTYKEDPHPTLLGLRRNGHNLQYLWFSTRE